MRPHPIVLRLTVPWCLFPVAIGRCVSGYYPMCPCASDSGGAITTVQLRPGKSNHRQLAVCPIAIAVYLPLLHDGTPLANV